MNKYLLAIMAGALLIACNNNDTKTFTVKGKITNAAEKTIYLEEIPVGTMRPTTVDTAELDKDGNFSLTTASGEATIYNLRIGQNEYPVASVINDEPSVTIDVTMSKENNLFPEKYDVKGSPASTTMKDFMKTFNDKLKQIFDNAMEVDSLRNSIAADSIINIKTQQSAKIAVELKTFTLEEIKKSKNVALTLFELGYYQSSANNPAIGLEPLDNTVVMGIVNEAVKSNPNHISLAGLKKTLDAQANASQASGAANLIGKPAPDFTLNDVDGKPTTLSSLKGKYVLVDFWASWCKPCRMENPNVVAAYNQFKNKNFTVLGVSLDENREAWENAIKADNLTWTHVSDLKNWESAVVPLYQIQGIPFNVLLDPQGNIIAQDLRGSGLTAKLSEVLQ
ncbi:MAG: redoxin domain-containing protein [Niabella sp.]